MRERDIIAAVTASCRRCPSQRNERFASDAEILEMNGATWAITVDDYSAEDRLSTEDPTALGWNLAVATISDLLAVGARPRFLLDSLVSAPWMNASFLHAFSAGIEDALTSCGAHLLGGDVGTGAEWRFTGVALGDFPTGRSALSRISSCEEGAVMASGEFGDGNLAAAGAGPMPRFEMRLAESAALAAIPGAAAFAPAEDSPATTDAARAGSQAARVRAASIDTSDGLVSALETLCLCDAHLQIDLDLSKVSYAAGVSAAAAALEVPREVFLMGSAGEYELLALVPHDAAASMQEAGMRNIGFFRRGSAPAGLLFRSDAGRFAHPGLPDPRECASIDDYQASLIDLSRKLFAGRPR